MKALFVTVAALLLTATAYGQSCPAGQIGLFVCVQPPDDPCEVVEAAPASVGQWVIAYAATSPPEVRPWVNLALRLSSQQLEAGFHEAVAAARCFSGSQRGPVNPAAVPSEDVKAWVITVLHQRAGKYVVFRGLVPIIEALPARDVCTAWRRAVEAWRGLAYGSLGNCL